MKTLIVSTIVALGIAGAANATDTGAAAMVGGVISGAETSGFAATRGVALPGMKGSTVVESGQIAGHTAGITGTIKFTEIDRGGRIRDVDGLKTSLTLDTFSEGVQGSLSSVNDKGAGTFGRTGGHARSGGGAAGMGGFKTMGFASW